MARGMGVEKNVHIENWAAFRENCEHVFKFSKANWARLFVYGFGVPIGIYFLTIQEFKTEGHTVGEGPERFGMKRKYLGSGDE